MFVTRQSTARTILVGPVLDSTGAAKTDEVVGSIKITKNGTVGAADGSATLTHDHAGKYKLALTANDCDTVGVLEISLNSGTNDMPVKACNVIETAIWDALFADGATGLLPANMTQISGDTQSATDLKDFADAGYDPATNKLTGAVELDSAARVKLASDQPDYDLPTNTEFNTALAASDDATLAAIAAEAVKTDAIKAKTDNLPSDPADQSLIIAATDAVMTRLGAPAGASIAADIAAIDGGGGGGDATLAKQEEILLAVDSVADTVAAYAARMALEVQLRGFPNVICRNADYLGSTESEIRITVEDLTGTAITEIAGTPVASLSWLFGMGTEQDPALIAGTCTWDGDSDELVIEIAKAATAGKQTGSLTWQIGVSIGAARRWLGGGTTRLIERQF